MLLEYENITIRNASVTDADLLATWWNDGKLMEHSGYPNGLGVTPDEVAKMILTESADTLQRYMILIDGNRVGEMVHRQVSPRVCDIGIKIFVKEIQNQGYGKKILSLFIYGLFDCLGYESIQLDTDLDNGRAQHVYESLGFSKLGVRWNSWVDQLGNSRSSVEYALTKEYFRSYLEE